MTKPGKLLTLLVVLAFAGFLLWTTLGSQQVECTACVTFNGRENCATASARDENDALRSVVSTACGTLSQGMDESIRCAGMPPQRPQCSTR